MRGSTLLLPLAVAILLPALARAQHSPRLSQTPELGGELVLGDDLTSLAAVFQTPLGRTTDLRVGAGAADPDDSDADGFVRAGLRAFVAPRSRGLPFDVALSGELDVFFGQDNRSRWLAAPRSAAAAAATARSSPTRSRSSSTATRWASRT
ncbi:MAG: hypothetical protein ABR599_08080 [Gemmatimonadota bacterium]